MLGISNGGDGCKMDDVDDDDITEPIAQCTSLPSSVNGKTDSGISVSSHPPDGEALVVSAIPEGIDCAVADLRRPDGVGVSRLDSLVTGDPCSSIINDVGMSLEEFIEHVRSRTRTGLFDEYSEIKSQPPEGTFDHARLPENLTKARIDFLFFSLQRWASL